MTKPARRPAAPELTDEEEARVQAMIARDPENPEITDEQAAQARPFAEAFPEMLAAIKRGRGRPPADTRKVAIKLRLDPETVEAFRATGPGWQTRMNEALAVASGGRKRRPVRRAAALSPECTPQVEAEMRSKV
ncbi:TPA: BrnA antitoxin family protein, partial [Klebsiella pneumoniae]